MLLSRADEVVIEGEVEMVIKRGLTGVRVYRLFRGLAGCMREKKGLARSRSC